MKSQDLVVHLDVENVPIPNDPVVTRSVIFRDPHCPHSVKIVQPLTVVEGNQGLRIFHSQLADGHKICDYLIRKTGKGPLNMVDKILSTSIS